jgi:hypothetical protein
MESVSIALVPLILIALFVMAVGGMVAIGIVWLALAHHQKIARSLPLVFGGLAMLLIVLVLFSYTRSQADHALVLQREREYQSQAILEEKLLQQAAEARQRQLLELNKSSQPGSGDAAPPTSAIASANAIPATDDRSTVDESPSAPPPDWVRAGVQQRGKATEFVCSSRQYATVEEADAEARAAVREYLQAELHRETPEGPFRRRTTADLDGFVSSVIRDRYVESVQRDFGSLFATMYRVWLRAEITPEIRQRLWEAQTASLQEGRLIVAGSLLGGLLCIPLGIVTYGPLNRWSQRRYSRMWQGAVAAGVLSLWAVGLFLLRQLVTWF